jgi:hypothetical protein
MVSWNFLRILQHNFWARKNKAPTNASSFSPGGCLRNESRFDGTAAPCGLGRDDRLLWRMRAGDRIASGKQRGVSHTKGSKVYAVGGSIRAAKRAVAGLQLWGIYPCSVPNDPTRRSSCISVGSVCHQDRPVPATESEFDAPASAGLSADDMPWRGAPEQRLNDHASKRLSAVPGGSNGCMTRAATGSLPFRLQSAF